MTGPATRVTAGTSRGRLLKTPPGPRRAPEPGAGAHENPDALFTRRVGIAVALPGDVLYTVKRTAEQFSLWTNSTFGSDQSQANTLVDIAVIMRDA